MPRVGTREACFSDRSPAHRRGVSHAHTDCQSACPSRPHSRCSRRLPAQASSGDVIRDCSEDGSLEGSYSQGELAGALDNLPSDLDEYTDCRTVIRRAQLAGAKGKGEGTPQGVVSRVDHSAPLNPDEQRSIDRGDRGSSEPVHIAGTPIRPGATGAPFAAAGLGTDLPTFVLAALVGLGGDACGAAFAVSAGGPTLACSGRASVADSPVGRRSATWNLTLPSLARSRRARRRRQGLRRAVGADGLASRRAGCTRGLDLPISLVLAAARHRDRVHRQRRPPARLLHAGRGTGRCWSPRCSSAAALLWVGFEARLHGGLALAALVALAGLTGLSILWSLYPSDSWVETNRTLAYLAAFGAGIAAVRLARDRWPAILAGVLLGLTAVCLWGLATKVAPGVARGGRGLRAAARALRLLERGRRDGRDGDAALPLARDARVGPRARERARLAAARPASPSRCC